MKRTILLSLTLFTIFGIFMVSIFNLLSTNEFDSIKIKKSFFKLFSTNESETLWFQKQNSENVLFLKIDESRKCLKSKNLTSQDVATVWIHIAEMVDECSNDFFDTLNETTTLKEILVTDLELKYFILPFDQTSASCNVISLGIGGETETEERVKKLMPQCKFLGIDSGAALSKEYYEKRLGGTYVEGLVGAKNGTFNASVLEKGAYTVKELQHYSFTFFLSKYFNGDLIDLVFMDIEGDEFELMKDMIDNPELYPTICQINVEFHESPKKAEIMLPLFSKLFEKSSYMAIKSGRFFHGFINKFHLINVKNDECLKKYFVK